MVPGPFAPSPAVQRMERQLVAWRDAGDGRAVFLGTYTVMTRAMLTQLDDGCFEDRAWVTDLLERFAGRYFAALDGFDDDRVDTPAVWTDAHRAAQLGAAPPHRLSPTSFSFSPTISAGPISPASAAICTRRPTSTGSRARG